MSKTVILMKTHIWNESLEQFAIKICSETRECNVDFFILMHTDDGTLFNEIKSSICRDIVLCFSEDDIKSIYPIGFISMYWSNHWVLMWYFRQFPNTYQYYWSIEYDVRISGPSKNIWNYIGKEDFLYTLGNYIKKDNKFNNSYTGNQLAENQKYHGYLQLARYSNRFLQYLDKCYADGENGQDELITYSLLHRGNFNYSKRFLQRLIRGVWTWQKYYNIHNTRVYELMSKPPYNNYTYIYHPVK